MEILIFDKNAYKFHILYKQMLNPIISVQTEWSAENIFVSMATHNPK